MADNPKAGQYILWRRYRFCHILKEDYLTFCGVDIHHEMAWRHYVVFGAEAKKRPVCGTCRKLSERKAKKVGWRTE